MLSRATSLATLTSHQGQVYAASWSPREPKILATCGQDGFLHIFDLRAKELRPTSSIRARWVSPSLMLVSLEADLDSETDLLFCDWNKYDPLVATAGKNSSIGIWDTRQMTRPVSQLRGHKLAVRKVA